MVMIARDGKRGRRTGDDVDDGPEDDAPRNLLVERDVLVEPASRRRARGGQERVVSSRSRGSQRGDAGAVGSDSRDDIVQRRPSKGRDEVAAHGEQDEDRVDMEHQRSRSGDGCIRRRADQHKDTSGEG